MSEWRVTRPKDLKAHENSAPSLLVGRGISAAESGSPADANTHPAWEIAPRKIFGDRKHQVLNLVFGGRVFVDLTETAISVH